MKKNYLTFEYKKFEDGSGWSFKHGFSVYGCQDSIIGEKISKKGLNKLKKLHQWIGKVSEDIEDKGRK